MQLPRYTNISPARYMQQFRLQDACCLLLSTAMSINKIAFRVNYRDAYYFSNMFCRNLDMIPLEYRNHFGGEK
ncbi:helix-turn-helix domain-containing protein [uncultured Alistipes sp.]|uniref:helix-turn-helix domain-containing protein n=1 Tax=uncultured Alistipes sp. TaxID=538949 RepID=UPI003457D3FA